MAGYFIQIFATVLFALYFAVVKFYQKKEGDDFRNGFLFNAMIGMFSAVIFWVVNGFEFEFAWFSLLMATLSTLLVVGYTITSFKLLKTGTVALYTMFLMSGGMLVPYFWGIIVLNESITILNVCGVILMIAAMIIMNGDFKNFSKKQLALCIAVFVMNGFTSVISKTHQTTTFPVVSAAGLTVLGALSKFIICMVVYFILPKSSDGKMSFSAFSIGIFAVSAALSGAASCIMLFGASSIPATVLYPVNTGGTIIFSSLASLLFFKEKLRKKDVISIIICFIGTALFV